MFEGKHEVGWPWLRVTDLEDFNVILGHALHTLFRESLITDWMWSVDSEKLRRWHPDVEEGGASVVPTAAGVELYLWGMGQGKGDLSAFLDPESALDPTGLDIEIPAGSTCWRPRRGGSHRRLAVRRRLPVRPVSGETPRPETQCAVWPQSEQSSTNSSRPRSRLAFTLRSSSRSIFAWKVTGTTRQDRRRGPVDDRGRATHPV
jgi:hypothetical protein